VGANEPGLARHVPSSRTINAMGSPAASPNRPDLGVPKIADLVAGHIRRQIVLGELREGDALPSETALMEQFSISRPTLREAFRVLESQDLITVRRGSRGGARVQVPTHDSVARYAGLILQFRQATLADIFVARVEVEAPVARMLAERSDRKFIAQQLEEALEKPGIAYAPAFHEFNSLMVSLTGNETLVLFTGMLEYISARAALSYASVPHQDDEKLSRKAQRSRAKVIDRIREGDGAGAEAIWRVHLSEAGRLLMGTAGGLIVNLLD
jgi:DNA-binding FadR family transcriptional regulator